MSEVMAVRGAIKVRLNSKEAIFNATAKLLKKLLEANSPKTDDIISIFFTMTTDLLISVTRGKG
jgi:chorismate mutase